MNDFPKNQNPLEEILSSLKDALKVSYKGNGGRQGANGSGGGDGSGKSISSNVGVGIIIGLFGAWAVLSSFYTVDVSEEAVVVRFGKYVTTTQPGLHFKLPFGIDKIYKVASKRTLQEEFGFRTTGVKNNRSTYSKKALSAESLMLTGDLNVADVEWAVQYRIRDPWKFLFHARNVRRNIRDVSLSIMRRVVGDRLASDVLTTGRVEIASEAKLLTQKVLDQYDMGIHVEQVILQDVNPPDPVKPAFNEVNAAKQEQEQAINNAEREYNRVIPEARGKAQQLIANAEAYAIDVTNRAKGDATKFKETLRAYKKDPEITRQRIYLETMEEILGQLSGYTVVDKDLKGILPLYGKASTLAVSGAAASK